MDCPRCGADNADDATFCLRCGADLSDPQLAGGGDDASRRKAPPRPRAAPPRPRSGARPRPGLVDSGLAERKLSAPKLAAARKRNSSVKLAVAKPPAPEPAPEPERPRESPEETGRPSAVEAATKGKRQATQVWTSSALVGALNESKKAQKPEPDQQTVAWGAEESAEEPASDHRGAEATQAWTSDPTEDEVPQSQVKTTAWSPEDIPDEEAGIVVEGPDEARMAQGQAPASAAAQTTQAWSPQASAAEEAQTKTPRPEPRTQAVPSSPTEDAGIEIAGRVEDERAAETQGVRPPPSAGPGATEPLSSYVQATQRGFRREGRSADTGGGIDPKVLIGVAVAVVVAIVIILVAT